MRNQLAIALFVAGITGTGSAVAGESVTLKIQGPPDAVVHYSCDFTGGGTENGDVRPPFETSWNVYGLSCRLRQIKGQQGVDIELDGDTSLSRVSTGGQGTTVQLSWGVQP